MRKAIKVFILVVMLLIVSCISVTGVFADAGNKASVNVYVTISNDSDFVKGSDGTVMAHVPFTVEYFDLADYSLENYYRLDDEDEVIEEPTVLHLLIRVLERYYAMRKLDKAGDMHSDIIDVTGGPRSLWLNRFWGHDGNLMYFVNHMYPLMSAKWGATADYILLNDGDDVDLAMYTDWGFYTNSAFLYFDKSTSISKTDNPLELQLLAKPTAVVNDGVDRESIPMQNETIRISSDYGKTWRIADEKTDNDGMISLTFDSPGTYYVASGPDHSNYKDAAPAICVVDVYDITPEEQALIDAKQKAVSELKNYKSSDLYREAEQALLEKIITGAETLIDKAESMEEVETALANAKKEIDEIKTDSDYQTEERAEEEARKELDKAKSAAKAELIGYKSASDYREAEKALLAEILADAETAVDTAGDAAEVETITAEYKEKMDALKTDAEYTAEEKAAEEERKRQEEAEEERRRQEEAAEEERKKQEEAAKAEALLAAKKEAVQELFLYVAPADYRDAEKEQIFAIQTKAEAKINQALTEDEVRAVLADAKALMDQLKTDEQYRTEEEAARKMVQKITVKVSRLRKFKAAKLRRKKAVFRALTVKGAKGKVTYKVSGNRKSKKALKFNKKTRKITVRKGTKKGLYKLKIRVNCAGTEKYLAASKKVTMKVRVK